MAQNRRHFHSLPSMASPLDSKPASFPEPDLRKATSPPDAKPALFETFDRSQPAKAPLCPPPSYAQARQEPVDHLRAELPPIKSSPTTGAKDDKPESLPSLSSLASPPEPVYSPPPPPQSVTHWPSLNPLTAYYNPSHAQNAESPMRMDTDAISNSSVSGASSDRYLDGSASSVTLDDPDVRMAAEALGDLRAGKSGEFGARCWQFGRGDLTDK